MNENVGWKKSIQLLLLDKILIYWNSMIRKNAGKTARRMDKKSL